ncbi:hypothetical protein [Zhongshania arctica]|uniref:Uncharacterized protein n=1 Tax=Zhongshania arctica TaxID=3238302 RepID=A0ABV3TX82_9GAMM
MFAAKRFFLKRCSNSFNALAKSESTLLASAVERSSIFCLTADSEALIRANAFALATAALVSATLARLIFSFAFNFSAAAAARLTAFLSAARAVFFAFTRAASTFAFAAASALRSFATIASTFFKPSSALVTIGFVKITFLARGLRLAGAFFTVALLAGIIYSP